MSLYECSEEEYDSTYSKEMNETLKNHAQQTKLRDKKNESGKVNKMRPKKLKLGLRKKETMKMIDKKGKSEKPESPLPFSENIKKDILEIENIQKNLINNYNENISRNKIIGVEYYYDNLFKNNEISKDFISKIKAKFEEIHNSESIFRIYYEIMKIIEGTDYTTIKNWLFYLLIKEMENKCINENIYDLQKLINNLLRKYDDKSTNKISPKKRKRSYSISEDNNQKSKKKKFEKEKTQQNVHESMIEEEKSEQNHQINLSQGKNRFDLIDYTNQNDYLNDYTNTINPETLKDKLVNKKENNNNIKKYNKSEQIDKDHSINKDLHLIKGNIIVSEKQPLLDPAQKIIKSSNLLWNFMSNKKEKNSIDKYK